MIQSKDDLKYYLEQDRIAYEKPIARLSIKNIVKELLYPDRFYNYMKTLRHLEFYTNNRSTFIDKIMFYYYGRKLGGAKRETGIDLDANVAGPGLRISHGKCVVSVDARLGEGCKILSDVTIGKWGPYNRDGAPRIGNHVYIGTGARIIGDIEIADDVVIGANSVVCRSITERGITVAGNPAKKVSNTDSWWYIHRNAKDQEELK